ncbi:hypothetical protein [Gluconobacter roseus]|uniref:Uncharacterized protein n=1 Tax=Gluconobacter roseus NBRC 3990 TaxID=1307950 RepID=A0A4Y3M7D3_9PROT|nr:hypothetical protein [Gluconobacter roseus]KXV43927.1 hypothetical protein AD943_05675 [Gluconobacter roseus]GBR48181.1 hypothetical protein AA3990_2024 [Gluconobacter roseus NBRC 3990]GEB03388.1 hypothetical protein GRO01_09640 [Gluconobacter roseus NBRC 3990]GLP93846.1 hypothetical protein GCM10007871_18240 [Gluconobacter roseus NBRC 3990]
MTVRIHDGMEADARRTPLEGGVLGWAAVAMLGVCLIALHVLPRTCRPFLQRFVRIWTAGLFCFFAGVHRGASFYNPKGPQLSDPVIFLIMHFFGLGVAMSPPRLSGRLAMAGTLATLAGDVHLARQDRLPRFFVRLRPAQLLTAFILIALLARTTEKED